MCREQYFIFQAPAVRTVNTPPVSAYYHNLAMALRGKSVPQDGWSLVLARVGAIDCSIAGTDEGIFSIRLDGLFGSDLATLRALFEQPASRDLLKKWGVAAKEAEVLISDGQPVLTFPLPQPRLPGIEPLAEWLQWVAEQARPFLLLESLGCSDCGADEAEIVGHPKLPGRFCTACRDENFRLIAALEALPAADQEPSAPAVDFSADLDPVVLREKALKYERQLRVQPRLFAVEMLFWVALGQVALAGGAGMLAFGVFLVVGLGTWLLVHGKAALLWLGAPLLKLGIKLAVPIGLVLTALFQSMAAILRRPPRAELQGLRLERATAPRFFSWLDGVAQRIGTASADVLLLTDEMNAAALERREGWRYCRIVKLGVPVIETFSPEELEIVMAHELSHLSHGDSGSAWIYRTARSWSEIGGQLEGEGGLNLFAVFARWYLPHFLVRAQAAARDKELAADRRAVQGKPPGSGAAELMKFEVLQSLYHHQVGPTLHQAGVRGELETYDVVRQPVAGALAEPPSSWRDILQHSVLAPVDWLDTHPPLADRLKNLDFPEEGIFTFQLSVAANCTELFENYSDLRAQVVGNLNKRLRLNGKLAAMRLPGLRNRIERLSACPEDALTSERVLHKAMCAVDLEDFELAEHCLRSVLDDEKTHVRDAASTKLISILLEQRRDGEALDLAARRLQGDPDSLHWRIGNWLLHQRRGDWTRCWELCGLILEHKELDDEKRCSFERRRDHYARLIELANPPGDRVTPGCD